MTLVTGVATTLAALFPALVMQLLDFVALYGLLLMPMGAVIFADYWLFPRIGLRRNFAGEKGLSFSWPAFLAWIGSVGIAFLIPLEIFFKALPAWFIAIAFYVGASWIQQRIVKRSSGGELR